MDQGLTDFVRHQMRFRMVGNCRILIHVGFRQKYDGTIMKQNVVIYSCLFCPIVYVEELRVEVCKGTAPL